MHGKKIARKYGSVCRLIAAALMGLGATAAVSHADEVVLNNGDKLTGKIGLISGGTMKFSSPSLGDISIKLESVKTYTTDAPATLRMENRQFVTGAVKDGNATQITTADGKTYNTADVVRVNPPQVGWTGAIVANGSLTRGNSNTESFGLGATAALRRDTPENDDRLTFVASDNFARTGKSVHGSTTADNTGASVAYDDFFTDKFYGYGTVGYYRDRVAQLNYRLTPGVGVGYQWFEQKDFNFSTEAGIAYLYQNYQGSPVSQNTAFRLGYHVDKAINDKVTVFNDVEYIAPFRFSQINRYVLMADLGVRANLTKNFFTEAKVVYNRNDHPVPGKLKDDLQYLLGVGWQF